MKQILAILMSLLMAPLRLLMDPWHTMHSSFGGALGRLSIPGIAAVLTFLFLALTTVAVFVFQILGRTNIDLPTWRTALPIVVLLIIVIPIVTYYTVRFWLQETGERFPDIEHAWNVGLEELKNQGFDLNHLPLFLVLGSETSVKDQYLFLASQRDYSVRHFPKGKGVPLRWYACDEGVFLVLSHVGCVTELARAAAEVTTAERVQVSVQGPSSQVGVSATCWPQEDESSIAEFDSGFIGARDDSSPMLGAAPMSNEVGFAGTMGADDADQAPVAVGGDPGSKQSPVKLSSRRAGAATRAAVDLEQRRLAFLCRLIIESRRPFCPINGVLLQIPLNLVLADDEGGALTMNAVASDFAIMNQRFRLRFPVVSVVMGWDEDLGFQEFRRRLGFDRTTKNRFGKGFGVGDPPLKDQLDALCHQACRAFEDWIYKLFREPDALSNPGNRALYSLLCKVRRYLYPRVKRILSDGLGCDEAEAQNQHPLIAGCYFAAAGAQDDSRAFCVQVFTRLIQANEDVEWTPAALRANWSCYTLAFSSLVVASLLIVGAVLIGWFSPTAAG